MLDICQSADLTEDCPGIEVNGQPLDFAVKFCYLGEIILGVLEGVQLTVLKQGSEVDGVYLQI